MNAVFSTFFQMGSAVALALLLFCVVPGVLFHRFVNRNR